MSPKNMKEPFMTITNWALASLLSVSLMASFVRADGNPMTDSMARTEGSVQIQGLQAEVVIDRDGLGIPRIEGETLRDVIRAQGYVHAQDRYVQMDMARRLASGELAALVGPTMLNVDRHYRTYRFRSVASAVVKHLNPRQRDLLTAYVEGVNAGLDDLGAPPPEYQLLFAKPEPWREEDSFLVALAMFDMLQSSDSAEKMLQVMREALPPEVYEFLTPKRSRFDVPLLPDRVEGSISSYQPMKIPGRNVIDVRKTRIGMANDKLDSLEGNLVLVDSTDVIIGSNNWAVAGSRSVHGGAILANDMHLALTAPGIWYRAEMSWGDRSVSGLTLPGVPGLVTGSTGDIAWGFTNTQGDFQDYIIIEVDQEHPDRYKVPGGWEPFEEITETIQVRGRKAEELKLRSTRWGIVNDRDFRGRPLVLKWVALMPETINLDLLNLLEVRNLDEAINVFRTLGIPSQNVLIADGAGRIGWIVSGHIPRRKGHDGMTPASWADGTSSWQGPLPENLRPMLVDPASGILFTANNRTVDGPEANLLGHAWASGYRAQRIAELLEAKKTFDERDLLAIQLDTRTRLFDFYRDLMLEAIRGQRDDVSRQVRDILTNWNGTADPDQPALRLLDVYRRTIHAKIFVPLIVSCRGLDENFRYRWSFSEETVRRILEDRPLHLLASRYENWTAFLESALQDTLADMSRRHPKLDLTAPWGAVNKAVIGHPLAEIVPQMASALRMPNDPLPGHWSSVRMATPRFGASARMVVSPGREERGILHMPSGQSGHPMSPHFRDGHEAWVKGLATPFLPGKMVKRLTLRPAD